MADEWAQYAVKTEAASSGQDEWAQYATKETPTQDSPAPEVSKPTFASEALKVAGQSVESLDVGNKPVSEIIGGMIGSGVEKGIKLVSLNNVKDAIKKFALSGPQGIVDLINTQSPQETLHSKYGFPVLPQPETNVGKALGMVANIAGQTLMMKGIGEIPSSAPSVSFPKVSQIEEAIKGIDKNVSTIKAVNKDTLFKAKDTIDTNRIAQSIRDSETLSKLQPLKSKTAYNAAAEISGTPGGDIGLGLKASKNLNKQYWDEVEPHYNEEVYVDDVKGSIESTLQNHGIMDATGKLIEGAEVGKDQAKLLKVYNQIETKDPEGIISLDMKKIKIGELRNVLEGAIGRGEGANNLITDVFQEAGKSVQALKEITAKYAPQYQIRNAVFDKFNIFNRMGWRKGEASHNSGALAVENVAHEDPSQVNQDNVKMFDFIKEYTGKDPSAPVKAINNQIVGIKTASKTNNIGQRVFLNSLKRDIHKTNMEADAKAESMKTSLENLKVSAQIKEANAAFKKKAAIVVGATVAGGPALHSAVKKVLPFIP